MNRRKIVLAASAGGLAGVLGLTALSLPAGAGPDPQLPSVAPEQLLESVLTAAPPAATGTVRVDNALGLPSLPGDAGAAAPMLADGTSTFRVWSDGQGRVRASAPSSGGELTVVDDGTSVWKWDSRSRTATRAPAPERTPTAHELGRDLVAQDPAALSRQFIGRLRQTSDVAVDGTARVAGRDAYELVLTPKPTERTVLREVRFAVDAQTRSPLQVTVNTNGSEDPALRAGFSELDLTRPDPALFRFTPPAGAKVEEANPDRPHRRELADHPRPAVVGDGWDTVVVAHLPQHSPADRPGTTAGGQRENVPDVARQIGKRVNGPWDEGWLISTKAGSALVTTDGRVAGGAVPEQVLTAAVGTP